MLRGALSNLVRARFLADSGENFKNVRLGHYGLVLRDKLVQGLRQGFNKEAAAVGKAEGGGRFEVEFGEDKNEVRLVESKEGSQLILSSELDSGDKWKHQFQEVVGRRRKLWKRYITNPWSIEVSQNGATTASDSPEVTLSCKFEDQEDYRLSHKPMLLEEIRLSNPKGESRTVGIKSHLDMATMALLLDAFRKRQFLDSTRLSLHTDLAPYQTAFVSEDSSSDLSDLKRLLFLLSEREGLAVAPMDEVYDFGKCDELGIPYAVSVSEDSLRSAVVGIRDRDTCLMEQIHVSQVTKRLVRIFQRRVIKDTWEEMRGENDTKSKTSVSKR